MTMLKRFHGWLDGLSERTKIVGLLAAIAIGLTLVGGVALIDAREGDPAAVQDAYENRLGLAHSLNDGLWSRAEITSACSGVPSAARASSRGVEATYTSEQAAAFYRGCEDGAPEADGEPGQGPDESPPDEPGVAADIADAYAQGQEMGSMILAQDPTLDTVSFERLVDKWYQATVDWNTASAFAFSQGGSDPARSVVLMPNGTMAPMKFSIYPNPEEQLNAFRQGALDAWAAETTRVGEGTDSPNPLAQGTRFDGFKTPSGNIICWTFEVMDSAEPFQLECAVLSEGKTWVLPQTEEVTVFDDVNTDHMAPALDSGQRWSANSLTCFSQAEGLSCRDDQTGHGFFLSREEQRVY